MPGETFGQYLKRERELRQISLEEVASGTKIAIHMLRAMEADRWDEIPAEVFIRGFIKHYAEFIGLIPEEVYLRYQQERGILPEEDLEEGAQRNTTELRGGRLFWAATALLIALLILVAGLFFLKSGKGFDAKKQNTAVSTQGRPDGRQSLERPTSPVHPGEFPPANGRGY